VRIFLNANQKEAFRSITDYFATRRTKTLARKDSSCFRAEIGSWFSFVDEGNAKGEVEVKVINVENGSYVHVDFDFMKEYSLGFLAAILGAGSCYFIGSWLLYGLTILKMVTATELWTVAANLLAGVLAVALFTSLIVLESLSISRTKKRFIDEFAVFVRLSAVKDC
jgi:hypothetical protein